MRVYVGEVKVRFSSKPKQGSSLEVTIPSSVVKVLQFKVGDKVKVFYDTEKGEIVMVKSVEK